MPRECKLWKCNHCGKTYESYDASLECETRHIRPVSIEAKWYPTTGDDTVPEMIDVRMNDGSVIKYRIAY